MTHLPILTCHRLRAAVLILLLVMTGCLRNTATLNFFTLSPTVARSPNNLSVEPRLRIVISAVRLPDYLERAEIVTRRPDGSVTFSEYDLWAGSFRGEVTRTLVENLAVLLAEEGIYVQPGPALGGSDYRLQVYLNSFEGLPGGEAVLNAFWSISAVRGLEESRVGTAYIIVRAAGPSCADLVKAMSGALGELSRRLAADLANLPLPLPPYMESNR